MIPLRPWRCLLPLVSWLLVVLIPGLLMVATFGLERVESGLRDGTLSAADVDEFLEQAKATEAEARAREVADTVPYTGSECVCEQSASLPASLPMYTEAISARALPTGDYLQHLANPEFRQTRHANRV